MNKTILTILLTLTIWSCGGGGSSSASPCSGKECAIGIKMIHIDSELSFDYLTAELIVRESIRYLNENTTTQFVYKGGSVMPDPDPSSATLDTFLKGNARLKMFEHILYKNPGIGGNYKARELTIIIDRPLLDGDIVYTAGEARICALYQRGSAGVSYIAPKTNSHATASSKDRTLQEMINRGIDVTAHEIGHLAGARHRNCFMCLMNEVSANPFGDINQTVVSEETNREIEVCTRRETRRKVLTCRAKLNRRRCKKRARIKNIRLRDVKFKEKHNRSLESHTCNLLED